MLSPLPEISQQHSVHSVHLCMAFDNAFTRSRPPTGMAPNWSLVLPAPNNPIDSLSVWNVRGNAKESSQTAGTPYTCAGACWLRQPTY